MHLMQVLDQVMMERDLENITENQYRKSIEHYSEFLGHVAEIEDLCYALINSWLKSLKGKFDATTICNRKKGLTVVWNHLAELGKIEHYHAKRLFAPKVQPKPVVSWTLDDFQLLVQAAQFVPGEYHGIPNSRMLIAWLWVGLDTAFRPSDMRRILFDQIDYGQASITLSQHKTGYVHRACLSNKSLKAIMAIAEPRRDVVFPVTKDEIRYPLKRLYSEAAKLGFRKTPGRSIGTLRRLHATLQYEDHGASVAAESLGHVGGTRTVYRSYIDHRSRRQGRLPRHASPKDPSSG
jgi:hypothetical protein